MKTRTRERNQFLSDTLVGAIEHAGYGFPEIVEYVVEPDGDPAGTYAVITDRYDDEDTTQHRVTVDTIAKGFGVIRRLGTPNDMARDLLLADRTNGEDGDLDVVGALAVLECALFGKVVYN